MCDYIVAKTKSEKYTFKFKDKTWCVFIIDEEGTFNCQSSHGNYQYRWPYHNRKSFKHFIIELSKDPYYFLKKVSSPTIFNFNESLDEWKLKIIEMRRDDISKKQARQAWNYICTLSKYSYNETLVQEALYDSKEVCDICSEPWEAFNTVKCYPPGAEYIATTIMPMFADVLKKEIEGEQQHERI